MAFAPFVGVEGIGFVLMVNGKYVNGTGERRCTPLAHQLGSRRGNSGVPFRLEPCIENVTLTANIQVPTGALDSARLCCQWKVNQH